MSQSIYDKIINHYVSRFILIPKLSKYLNNRNCATRKNMGIDLVKVILDSTNKPYINKIIGNFENKLGITLPKYEYNKGLPIGKHSSRQSIFKEMFRYYY